MINFKNWKWIAIVFLVVLSTGCNEESAIPKPDNFIEEPQMVDVLADICKVEARYQRRLTLRNINISELTEHNYNLVFKENNITLVQFKDSYKYYEEYPEQMQNIYDSVIVHLTEEQVLLNEKKKETEEDVKEKPDKKK